MVQNSSWAAKRKKIHSKSRDELTHTRQNILGLKWRKIISLKVQMEKSIRNIFKAKVSFCVLFYIQQGGKRMKSSSFLVVHGIYLIYLANVIFCSLLKKKRLVKHITTFKKTQHFQRCPEQAFTKDSQIYHTYSVCARGLENFRCLSSPWQCLKNMTRWSFLWDGMAMTRIERRWDFQYPYSLKKEIEILKWLE